jgi:hypothetical protein
MRGCLKFNANDTLNVSPPQSQIGQFARSSVSGRGVRLMSA